MKHNDCLFCKIAGGEIPSKTVYEDNSFRVILDIAPATRGHVLIIPKAHGENVLDISDETAAGCFVLAKKLVAVMADKLGCEGVNIVQNNGGAAGQTVPHFHMHVIPRYNGDGQEINWTPGSIGEDELEAVKQQLQF